MEVMALTGDTIMVVEDDDATRAFLADNLKADSYGVVTASNARQALNLLEVKDCDLMLLDVMLPDSSGFEFCRSLREADGLAQPAAKLEAGRVGKHDVEQHQVAVLHLEQVERLPGVRGSDDVVAVRLEIVGEERAGRVVVLDDHDRVAGQGHHLHPLGCESWR